MVASWQVTGKKMHLGVKINKNVMENIEETFTISQIMVILPSEQEAEEYAIGAFGYDPASCGKEAAFISGTDWMRIQIENKLKGLK
jgi:hypothetical protein